MYAKAEQKLVALQGVNFEFGHGRRQDDPIPSHPIRSVKLVLDLSTLLLFP